MSEYNYQPMVNLAAQAGGRYAYRGDFPMKRQIPGMAGGDIMRQQCHFPQPPPYRCYCHPAAFHSIDGRDKHLLSVAYGSSTPCSQYQ